MLQVKIFLNKSIELVCFGFSGYMELHQFASPVETSLEDLSRAKGKLS